jgi:type I restriction enzyme S subunit
VATTPSLCSTCINALASSALSGVPTLNRNDVHAFPIAIPKPPEQRAIADALGDVDALIASLDALIAKKRDIKQAAMQQLLTGKTRLPGFKGDWGVKTLKETMDCFDNVRVPLNEAQRAQMKGDYPYCGANGVLDSVNSYVIDDDIILIAEDGGYFDEYEYRPIAYRMVGKCWVNNHAHILKAKAGFDQGFLFYSLTKISLASWPVVLVQSLTSRRCGKLRRHYLWTRQNKPPLPLFSPTWTRKSTPSKPRATRPAP